MKASKKICFIGDSGVGKTTFIKLLITGTYTDINEKVLKENIIIDTKKFSIKYYNYPVELIDGSGIYEKEDLINIANGCNVVVLIYDFLNTNSFNRIKFELLPILKEMTNLYSVIVVGNKIDLLDTNTQKFVIEQNKTEIERFQDEMSINLKYFHISCKNYLGISNLFYEILNSLVNPSHIFFNLVNNEIVFNQKFEKALRRIFRIFDKEKKGVISKQEFNKIHEKIFDIKLENDHFMAIKECIKEISNTNYTGISNDDEMTVEGFVNLNKVAVQVGESQITWSALRKYGYNDSLELDIWYFKEKKFSKVNLSENIVELSNHATNLLTELFLSSRRGVNQSIENNKKINLSNESKTIKPTEVLLTEKDWDEIFCTCDNKLDENLSFHKIFRTFKNNPEMKISVAEWLFVWDCLTRMNYEEAFKIFLYLGYDINFEQFATIRNKKEIILRQPFNQKTVYVCLIAQNLESILNFIKHFTSFYALYENSTTKQVNILVKTAEYNIIISHFLLNELELTVSNVTNTIYEEMKKYDLLIYSDDILNLKIFNVFSSKIFSFILFSNLINSKKFLDKEKSFQGISQMLVNDEKMNEKEIIEKIIYFTRNPPNFLRVSERKELMKLKRKKTIWFSFKLFFIGFTGFFTYYIIIRKYNPFK